LRENEHLKLHDAFIIPAFHGQNDKNVAACIKPVKWLNSGMSDPQVETRPGYPNPPQYREPRRRSDGVPLPKARQWRNWRQTEKLTFGERLQREIDPDQLILTPDQHKAICELKDVDAVQALLSSDFGNSKNPDLARAADVFGALVGDGISVPRIIMILRFQTIAQLMDVAADSRAIYKKANYTKEQRLEALKCAKECAHEMNKIVSQLEKLARSMDYLQELPKDDPVADLPIIQQPRGHAPELE
jgi:hypothetical protein